MTESSKGLAASIHRRLLNGARDRGEDFQLTLLRYGAERLLYRLYQTRHGNRFILKGGLLLLLLPGQFYRPTRDLDLEGHGDSAPESLREVFREVCLQSCPEDAVRFDEDSVEAAEIIAAQEYGGVRVTLSAHLDRARIRLQIDIGFGNAITPAPDELVFPTLLPLPAPRLRTYPIETVVAEKFEAIVRFGRTNSRMKDFRDLATFARGRGFDGALLSRAVRATFAVRKANLDDLDEVFDPAFYEDSALNQRWRAYCRTTGTDREAETLPAIGAELIRFLKPLGEALHGQQPPAEWRPEVGWRRE